MMASWGLCFAAEGVYPFSRWATEGWPLEEHALSSCPRGEPELGTAAWLREGGLSVFHCVTAPSPPPTLGEARRFVVFSFKIII